MVLDRCIGATGALADGLLVAARRYNAEWRPEAEAVAWMAVRSLFENRAHMFRASITSRLGISVFDQAKSDEALVLRGPSQSGAALAAVDVSFGALARTASARNESEGG